VAVIGLLLALWFVFDISLEGPGHPYKSSCDSMVGVTLLDCLVRVVATVVALVGV
jgi:hypothetical protein